MLTKNSVFKGAKSDLAARKLGSIFEMHRGLLYSVCRHRLQGLCFASCPTLMRQAPHVKKTGGQIAIVVRKVLQPSVLQV